MRPVQDVLNQIKWDKNVKGEDFVIEYIDFGKLVSMPYSSVKRVEGLFMIVEKNGEEVNIPLHRVRIIRQKGEVVWQR